MLQVAGLCRVLYGADRVEHRDTAAAQLPRGVQLWIIESGTQSDLLEVLTPAVTQQEES